jgi:hypothetical protein
LWVQGVLGLLFQLVSIVNNKGIENFGGLGEIPESFAFVTTYVARNVLIVQEGTD